MNSKREKLLTGWLAESVSAAAKGLGPWPGDDPRYVALDLNAQVAALQERVKVLEASRNIVKAATIRIFEDGCRYQREAETDNARLTADLSEPEKESDRVEARKILAALAEQEKEK